MLVDVFKKHSHDQVTVNEMTRIITVDCVYGDGDCSSATLRIREKVDYTGCERRVVVGTLSIK